MARVEPATTRPIWHAHYRNLPPRGHIEHEFVGACAGACVASERTALQALPAGVAQLPALLRACFSLTPLGSQSVRLSRRRLISVASERLWHPSADRRAPYCRRFLLEWLSFLHRYVPVGLLEVLPQRLNWRPPAFFGRSDLETWLASGNPADWCAPQDTPLMQRVLQRVRMWEEQGIRGRGLQG